MVLTNLTTTEYFPIFRQHFKARQSGVKDAYLKEQPTIYEESLLQFPIEKTRRVEHRLTAAVLGSEIKRDIC